MPRINRSALVPYAPERMFALVNDVERYPEFLPWCADARVREHHGDVLVAELAIKRAGVSQQFTTRNHLDPPERMRLELVEGPFARFHGHWHFRRLADDACKVELEMDFEYQGRLTRLVLGPIFDRSADSLVDAFCVRAREVYGRA